MNRPPKWDASLADKGKEAVNKASRAEIEAALKHAAEFIDTLPFKGERASAVQNLAWPRKGVTRDDGAPVLGVPAEIKEAAYLVARFILAKVPFDAVALAHLFVAIGHLLREQESVVRRKVTWH